MATLRTQVGIVGAGPAGLLLARLLQLRGIDSVIVENRSRAYIEGRIRAGVLEQGTVDVLDAAGVGARMHRDGLRHTGFELRFRGRSHRIALDALTQGKGIMVYGQHEVIKDLVAQRLADGLPLLFEVADAASTTSTASGRASRRALATVRCASTATSSPAATASTASRAPAFPAGVLTTYERDYPFAWLGILAEAAPAQHELVYARHARGFALFSMRSPTLTRAYVQCAPDDELAAWPDARIWEELHTRLETDDGWRMNEGPIVQKGITPMRSFVAAPMQHGRLFLAGDAAHIVPPTGAKGMNLAVSDVVALAQGLARVLRARHARAAVALLRGLPAARVEGRALLLAHDLDAAQVRRRRRVCRADAVRRARLLHRVARRPHVHCGELRRVADGVAGLSAACSAGYELARGAFPSRRVASSFSAR